MFKEIKSDATVDDVRKKINTLRSNYRKILKKIEDSKCWVFHGLNFLAEYEKPQASQSSIVKKINLNISGLLLGLSCAEIDSLITVSCFFNIPTDQSFSIIC